MYSLRFSIPLILTVAACGPQATDGTDSNTFGDADSGDGSVDLGATSDGDSSDDGSSDLPINVGDQYPIVFVTDCDGNSVDVRAHLSAHAVNYVGFCAGWTVACQEETPIINRELVDGLADEDVGIVQILIEGQPDEAPPQSLCATWRDDLAARNVVWVDTRQEHIGPFFGDTVSTLPLHLVVTQDGIIRARRTGAIPADIRSIIEEWLSQ